MRAMGLKKAWLAAAIAAATACALIVNGAAAAGGPSGHSAAVGVGVTGNTAATYAFSPTKVKIAAGKKVNWSWKSNAPHNVTFANGKHSKTFAAGSYSRRFAAAGKYPYSCTIHANMRGKVVVHG
jgi:plastocyanin